jgi:DDE superfamily endonuclease
MPGKAAKVVVTERQLVILEELSRSRSESRTISQRATIVLRAFAKRSNQEISAEVGLERKQVGLWRRRWRDAWEGLTLLECSEPRRLREAVRETLRDAPRPGAPCTFTAAQVAAILAVACEPPAQSGRPITHWTHRELRDEVLARGIVEEISESRLGHFLREAALRPHRRKMWLNTKEKDPEVFQRQVEEVCETYLAAPGRHAERGTHTVCCDEMTGVQALERIAPHQPPRPGRPAREEFEYVRHGTTTMIGNLNVVDGEVTATIGPTRTEVDFVGHIRATVAGDPHGEWIFVVDTLNVHWSAGLVEWVAERCEPDRPLGKKRGPRRAPQPGQPSRLPVRPGAPHPLRVPAQAQFVAEPDRDGVRDRDAKGRPPGELHVGRRPRGQTASLPGLLQPDDGPPLRVDVHRPTAPDATPHRLPPTPPPPSPVESHTGETPALMAE